MKLRQWLWLLPLFILPLCVSFFSSGIELDGDDLKYMGMAWGMQHSGNYLIPMANGVPYTDKPPLLFWMIALCWHVFGENMLVLQCLICVLMAIWVLLTQATYKTLFPEDGIGKTVLPYIMISCFAFLGYAHFLHVDLFLVTGVLLTNLGICQRLFSPIASKKITRLSSIYIIFGILIGLFAKGPVVYVFTLLPLLLGAFIQQSYRAHLLRILGETLLGTALCFFSWVVPVILNASHEFLQQILYKQIADRAVQVSDKSYFFYLLRLPYLLIPWAINIIFIRKLSGTILAIWKKYALIVLIIIVCVLVLSFFGQKRFWYLLPSIPYALIILTRFFVTYQQEKNIFRINFALFYSVFLAVAAFSVGAWFFPVVQKWLLHGVAETAGLSPIVIICLFVTSSFMVLYLSLSWRNIGLMRLLKTCSLALALIYVVLCSCFFALTEEHDQLQLIKTTVQQQVKSHNGMAIFVLMHPIESFNYLAKTPVIPVFYSQLELQEWLIQHPHGIVIVSMNRCPDQTHLFISSHEMGYLLCSAA